MVSPQFSVPLTTEPNDITTTLRVSAPESIEIVRIFQPAGVANGVKIVWGREVGNLNLNVTYGVHYGTDDENLSGC